jgi:hypothetical protein
MLFMKKVAFWFLPARCDSPRQPPLKNRKLIHTPRTHGQRLYQQPKPICEWQMPSTSAPSVHAAEDAVVMDSAPLSMATNFTQLHTTRSQYLRDWNHPLLMKTAVYGENRTHATPLLACDYNSSLHDAYSCAQPDCSLFVVHSITYLQLLAVAV